jgi:hypothetical protein
MSDTAILIPADQRFIALRVWVAERLEQHRENLDGWSEGRACPLCKGLGRWPGARRCVGCDGRKVLDPGYLVPTEPDPAERDAVRRELRAAIAELEGVAARLE